MSSVIAANTASRVIVGIDTARDEDMAAVVIARCGPGGLTIFEPVYTDPPRPGVVDLKRQPDGSWS